MKKANKIIEILELLSILLLVVFLVFLLASEFFGYAFLEKVCYKIGITHPLRFCYITGAILLALSFLFEYLSRKINKK